MMKLTSLFHKHWFFVTVLVVLFFSFFIRVVSLEHIPAGFTWDEAAIGYNGYAVWETRRDEWLHRLPVSFKSFGDYKAPLAIYINGFFTYVLSFDFLKKTEIPVLAQLSATMSQMFNLNVWTVRIPFVLSGMLGILGLLLLTQLLLHVFFTVKKESSQKIALVLGVYMSISPWHIHFTRAGFESGMSLTFLIWMEYFLLEFLQTLQHSKVGKTWKKLLWVLLSVLFLAATMYTYHSAKIVAPILYVCTIFLFHHWGRIVAKASLIPLIVGLVFSTVLLRPMVIDTLQGSGGERFSQTSVFTKNSDATMASKLEVIVSNYLHHFSPQFLFFGETTTLRHGDGQWGVLYVLDGVCIVITLFLYFQKKGKLIESKLQKKFIGFAVFWICIGLIPASIGTEIPHANRALLALPGFLLLSGIGFVEIGYLFSEKVRIFTCSLRDVVAVLFTISYLSLSLGYFTHYFKVYAKESEQDFYYGYVQAMEFAKHYEDGVDKILFTSKYGQPYIYALFVRKTNPIWYQGGSLVKFEFTDNIHEGDLQRKNTLIVAAPDEIDPKFADQLVIATDGKVKFVLVKPRE